MEPLVILLVLLLLYLLIVPAVANVRAGRALDELRSLRNEVRALRQAVGPPATEPAVATMDPVVTAPERAPAPELIRRPVPTPPPRVPRLDSPRRR